MYFNTLLILYIPFSYICCQLYPHSKKEWYGSELQKSWTNYIKSDVYERILYIKDVNDILTCLLTIEHQLKLWFSVRMVPRSSGISHLPIGSLTLHNTNITLHTILVEIVVHPSFIININVHLLSSTYVHYLKRYFPDQIWLKIHGKIVQNYDFSMQDGGGSVLTLCGYFNFPWPIYTQTNNLKITQFSRLIHV